MEKISKQNFCLLLAIRPRSIIGKEIVLKNGKFVKVLDISLGGNYIFIGGHNSDASWTGIDILDDELMIDRAPLIESSDIISVKTLDDISDKLSRYRGGKRYA